MALDKVTLKTSFVAAMTAAVVETPTAAQASAIDDIATAYADAIDIFVKSGSVTAAIDPGALATGVTVGAAAVPVTGTTTGTIT